MISGTAKDSCKLNGEKIVGKLKNGLIDCPAIFTTFDSFDLEEVWKDGIWQDV
jgi:hypothetical protein